MATRVPDYHAQPLLELGCCVQIKVRGKPVQLESSLDNELETSSTTGLDDSVNQVTLSISIMRPFGFIVNKMSTGNRFIKTESFLH